MTQSFRFISEHEKEAYEDLFKKATKGEKVFLYKQEALSFFETSGLPVAILNQIWYAVDSENRDYITQDGFFTALKLIACYQNEKPLTHPIDMIQVPVPQFRAISVDEITPMTEAEREKYINIFESCQPKDGVIDDQVAMAVLMRSNLPIEKLNLIWNLADTRRSSTLNKTEFIIAMHYVSRAMSNPNIDLPTALPPQTYKEATGRFGSSLRRHATTMVSPIMRNRSASISSLVSSSSSFTSPRMAVPVTIPLDESERYRTYFERLDTDGLGYLTSEVAGYFFIHSKLPEADLAQIWNMADVKRLGKLDLHEFSVAMHLITRRQNGDSMQELAYRASELNQINIQPAQNIQVNHKKRIELEKQLEEIKKEVQTQWQLAEEYRAKKKDVAATNAQLEKDIFQAKDTLELAKKSSEEAEKVLEIEQEKLSMLRQGRTLTSFSFNNSLKMDTKEPTMPDLTRTPSEFSNSTGLLSPPPLTQTANLNSGKIYSNLGENYNKPLKAPLSPVQSKAISKYGFDITAFETPSEPITNVFSDKDELAMLFGAPVLQEKKTSTFDDIFL